MIARPPRICKPDQAARDPPALDPRLLPQQRRAAVGLVDRRPHDPRADHARPARRPADPLDAEHAGARPADEGDSEEVQGRPPEDERGAPEVLPGEQHQPGLVVPAASPPVPGLHLALLRASAFREGGEATRERPRRPVVAARRAEHRRQRAHALVGLPPALHLRGEPGRIDVLHVRDDGQDAALDHDGAADRLHPADRELPGRPRPVLDDDQPLDGGPGPRHAPACAEAAGSAERTSRTPPKQSEDGKAAAGKAQPPAAPKPTGQPRVVRRKKKRARR